MKLIGDYCSESVQRKGYLCLSSINIKWAFILLALWDSLQDKEFE